MCQAYADFFRVHIHLYTLIGQGNRRITYIPAQFAERGRHVHLVVDQEHCFSITHVRHFMAKTSSSMQMSLHNYCDICTYTTCDSVNAAKMREHFTKCLTSNKECRNCTLVQFEENSVVTPKPFAREKWIRCEECGTDKFGDKRSVACTQNDHTCIKHIRIKCNVCKMYMTDESVRAGEREASTHKCYILPPMIKDSIPNDKLYVYDIEAMQFQVGELIQGNRLTPLNAYQHQCNLVCLRPMYETHDEEPLVRAAQRLTFEDIDVFCDHIFNSPEFEGAVIIAHNGGGYDHQYVLQYCEKRSIPHRTTPHPASKHRFLCLEMTAANGTSRKFIDSMAFITGSLRKIGQDFGLPISKGDFPHNFSRPGNQNYIGSIPPLHTPEDYFCLNSKRSQEEIDEMMEWHARESTIHCTCGEACVPALEQCGACLKRLWVFRDKLVEYCWLDVDVLAEVCKQYREVILTPSPPEEAEEGWNYPGLDPFSMLTMSQIGITAFMNGHLDNRMLFNSQFSEREGYNPKSNQWLYDIWKRRYHKQRRIIYKGTSLKEWYCMETESYYPGYCPETNTIFIFYDCAYHNCKYCYHECDRSTVMEKLRMRDRTVLQVHYQIEEIWEHEFDHYYEEVNRGVNERKIMEDRSFFYGGRTEVFSPYMAETEEYQIKYMDVTSLYPTVCAGGGGVDDQGVSKPCFDLPIDEPKVIHMPDLHRCSPFAANPYWGFVYCRVIPNKKCLLGLLPGRDAETGRLQFTLHDQEGCWHTEELYLAMRNGYIVQEIYQVFHWDEDARSNTYMKGYVAFFLRMKQEADGWKKAGGTSENPTEDEKTRLIENLFVQNGNIARMRREKVLKSPVKRQIAKLFLNSIWGKYAQKKQDDYFITINGYQQYMQFINHPIVDRERIWFRHVKENMFKVRYHRLTGRQTPNAKYNIFLAASVTAHARCYLHGKMLHIGPEKMGYGDTDSIIFLDSKDPAKSFKPGVGLGKWTDEYPNKVIQKLYALAPKSYNLEFQGGGNSLKSKGISLTLQNQNKVHHRLLGSMLESVFMTGKEEPMPQVFLNHMNITANSHYAALPYATLMTINSEKIMRPVLTKRQIVHYTREDRAYLPLEQAVNRLYTVPLGFFRDEGEIQERILKGYRENKEGVVDCASEVEL